MLAVRSSDLVEGPVHLRLLPGHSTHEVGISPGVQKLRPVCDAPLVRCQRNPVARVELPRTDLCFPIQHVYHIICTAVYVFEKKGRGPAAKIDRATGSGGIYGKITEAAPCV